MGTKNTKVVGESPAAEDGVIVEGEVPGRRRRGRWVTWVCCMVIGVVAYVMASGPYLGLLAYASVNKGWIEVDTANTLGMAYEPLGWVADASPAAGRLIGRYVLWWMELYGVGTK